MRHNAKSNVLVSNDVDNSKIANCLRMSIQGDISGNYLGSFVSVLFSLLLLLDNATAWTRMTLGNELLIALGKE